MNHTFFKALILSCIFAILLVGCGGGSNGGSTTTATAAAATSSSSVTSTSTVNATISSVIKSGAFVVVDAGVVSGLSIKCASEDVSVASDGSFDCNAKPISVYLGAFKLGEIDAIPSDHALFTQDIVGVSRAATSYPNVTKISMLLQSFDDDAEPLNGITLAKDTLSILSTDLSSQTTLNELTFEDINNIIKDVIATRLTQNKNSKLVAIDKTTAQSNLTITTAAIPAPKQIQNISGRSL